jgi:hypothetical protein
MGVPRIAGYLAVALLGIGVSLPIVASRNGPPSHRPSTYKSNNNSRAAPGVPRDSSGKIKRDRRARRSFLKNNPCPSTSKSSGACPDYVVDHVRSLKRGGPDNPSNMQWQTKEAAKEKDKWE